MQLSATSQYAIRILVYMAGQKDSQSINAAELAETLLIPYKFLAKIMTSLVKVGLVESIRGKEGGYKTEKRKLRISWWVIFWMHFMIPSKMNSVFWG